MTTRKIKYILDTNTLIGFAHWLPFEFHKKFWNKLTEALEKDKWVLLDVVTAEVTHPPELVQWCKEQKLKGLVKKISDADRNRASEINTNYPIINAITFNSETDTYILAYAEANSLGVFSREGPRKSATGLYKIPDICTILHIKCTRKQIDFLKEIDYVE